LHYFHVAGTNGKGSVCATLDALLRAQGKRVGRYTSPHLVDFRERVLVDGEAIGEGEVLEWIERRTPDIERIGATFFEATSALALEYFATRAVDVVVLETGLGGRLDSTNVVTPVVATVTSIGMDHMDLLGDTIEQIAGEKAGIFKPGRPAVIGERDDHVSEVLKTVAADRGASPVRWIADGWTPAKIEVDTAGTHFSLQGVEERRLTTPLAGAHQAWNAATALLTLDAAGDSWRMRDDQVQAALDRVRLPGRFQRVGNRIFDVAHNPDGARALAETLRSVGAHRPVVAVLSVLRDKDWRGVMDALSTIVDHFILTTAPTAPDGRAWDVEAALQHARANRWSSQIVADFDDALTRADAAGGTVLITGSFHTVGDAMARLQVDPLGG
jgi:dihydrofolate synthase/folylpolyglutamate synthase